MKFFHLVGLIDRHRVAYWMIYGIRLLRWRDVNFLKGEWNELATVVLCHVCIVLKEESVESTKAHFV